MIRNSLLGFAVASLLVFGTANAATHHVKHHAAKATTPSTAEVQTPAGTEGTAPATDATAPAATDDATGPTDDVTAPPADGSTPDASK